MGYHSPILTGEETNLKGIALGFLVVPTTDFLGNLFTSVRCSLSFLVVSTTVFLFQQALSRVLPRNSSNNNFGGLGFGIGPADVKFTISARDGFKETGRVRVALLVGAQSPLASSPKTRLKETQSARLSMKLHDLGDLNGGIFASDGPVLLVVAFSDIGHLGIDFRIQAKEFPQVDCTISILVNFESAGKYLDWENHIN